MMMRSLRTLLVISVPLWIGGCSEETQKPPGDGIAPEARLFYPSKASRSPFVVSDSVDVLVGAHDVGAGGAAGVVARVSFFASPPHAAEPVRIGEAVTPIPLDSVPEPLRRFVHLPAGWELYSVRWYVGTRQPQGGAPIASGTDLRLFATATDLAGNEAGTADSVNVLVYRDGESHPGPRAAFFVWPRVGVVDSLFWFDPTPTEDPISSNPEISVRWDFDGDPENGWDVDWSADARADQVVTRSFAVQGIYLIRMQAHNPYFPDSIAEAQPRVIHVMPNYPDGPPPPDPENYVRVPAGLYPISKADSVFVLDGRRVPVDASELPPHEARITQPFAISKYEVTSRLYLQYLERELQQDYPPIQYVGGEIRERVPDGGGGMLLCRLSASRIFFDLDQERFVIQAGFENHPVTGVTWYGAEAYVLSYGLRLPTEAEWEVAGRGAVGSLDYPFPGGIDPSLEQARRRMNFVDTFDPGEPFDGTTTPVGYFNGVNGTIETKSEFGLYDLSGNVAEWVSDWFGAYEPGTANDPTGPLTGISKVARGGGHAGTRVDCRATARRAYDPEACSPAIGFRCAMDVYP